MNNLKKIKKTLTKFSNFKKLTKHSKSSKSLQNSNILEKKSLKKNKTQINKKPTLFYVLIVLAFFANIAFALKAYDDFIDSKTVEHQQIASHVASDYEGFLNYSQLLLNSVNHEILKSKSFGDKTVDILSSIDRIRNQNNLANQMYFEGMLYWIDSNKYLIASSAGKVLKPIDLSSRDYLEKTEHEPWKLQVGKAIIGALSGQYILPIAVGVSGEKGYHLGTSVLSVRIESLVSKIRMSLDKNVGSFAVLSNEGRVVFESNKKNNSKLLEQIAQNYDFSNKLGVVKKFNLFKSDDFFVVASRVLEYPFTIFYSVDNHTIIDQLFWLMTPYLVNLMLLIMILIFNPFSLRSRVLK